MLVAIFGPNDEAYRYGQVSLALLEQYFARPWLPKVYASVDGYVFLWFLPFRESREPLERAFRVAIQTGDMEGAMVLITILAICSLLLGTSSNASRQATCKTTKSREKECSLI